MNSEQRTIIEVNGIKMEVDLRHAKRVEEYRVGDNVKVLVKGYGDSYESCAGVIVGFDAFRMRPTIVVCYLKPGYGAEVKFAFITPDTKDIEIIHMADYDKLLDADKTLEYLEREIIKKEAEVLDLKMKKDYFVTAYEKIVAPINKEEIENANG